MTAAVSRAAAGEQDPRRAAILEAAIAILRDQGAAAMTVRAVAAGAGCSTTGVYTWFGGKHGLVEAIFRDGFRRFGVAVGDAPRPGSSDPKRLAASMGDAYRRWALANPTHYSVMFGHAVPDYEPSEDARSAALDTFRPLVRVVERLVDAGTMVGEPLELATFIWATIHGYVSLEIASMDVDRTPAARDAAFAAGMRRAFRACTV